MNVTVNPQFAFLSPGTVSFYDGYIVAGHPDKTVIASVAKQSSLNCRVPLGLTSLLWQPNAVAAYALTTTDLATEVQAQLQQWQQTALPQGWPAPDGKTTTGQAVDKSLTPNPSLYLSESDLFALFLPECPFTADQVLQKLILFFCSGGNGYLKFFTCGDLELNPDGTQVLYRRNPEPLYALLVVLQNLQHAAQSVLANPGSAPESAYATRLITVVENLGFALDQTLDGPYLTDPHWAEINDANERVNIYAAEVITAGRPQMDFGDQRHRDSLAAAYHLRHAQLEPWALLNEELREQGLAGLRGHFAAVQGLEEAFAQLAVFEPLLAQERVAQAFPQNNVSASQFRDRKKAADVMACLNVSRGAGLYDALYLYAVLGHDLYGVPSESECQSLAAHVDQTRLTALYQKIPASQKATVYAFAYRMALSRYDIEVAEAVFEPAIVHFSFFDPNPLATSAQNLWCWWQAQEAEPSESETQFFAADHFAEDELFMAARLWTQAELTPPFPDPRIHSQSQITDFLNVQMADPLFYENNRNFFAARGCDAADSPRQLLNSVDFIFSEKFYRQKTLAAEVDAVLVAQFQTERDPQTAAFAWDGPSQILWQRNLAQMAAHDADWPLLNDVLFAPYNEADLRQARTHSAYNPNGFSGFIVSGLNLENLYSAEHYQFLFAQNAVAERDAAAQVLNDIRESFADSLPPSAVQARAEQWQNLKVLQNIRNQFATHYLSATTTYYQYTDYARVDDIAAQGEVVAACLDVAILRLQSQEVSDE